MKALHTLVFLLPLACFGQTTWNVSSGGSTQSPPNPYYTPQNLTINVGDIVHWTNVSGTHSVDGSLSEFPGNPQGFSTGDPESGAWTFDFTFTIPGVYNYHCTQQGHAATQTGSITVVNPGTGVAQLGEGDASIKVYPVPTNDVLYVEAGANELRSASVIGLNGEQLLTSTLKATGQSVVEIATLAAGNYFLLVTDARGMVTARAFSKR